jgi:hypothetical protein
MARGRVGERFLSVLPLFFGETVCARELRSLARSQRLDEVARGAARAHSGLSEGFGGASQIALDGLEIASVVERLLRFFIELGAALERLWCEYFSLCGAGGGECLIRRFEQGRPKGRGIACGMRPHSQQKAGEQQQRASDHRGFPRRERACHLTASLGSGVE